MIQNGARQAEVPAIGFKAQRLICGYGIETLILEGVGSQLGHEAYTTSLLLFVDQESATFFRDYSQSKLQLLSAITAQ